MPSELLRYLVIMCASLLKTDGCSDTVGMGHNLLDMELHVVCWIGVGPK